MNIGIIGAGNVGQALGKGLTNADHTVTISSRDPDSEKLQAWKREAGPKSRSGTFSEAAQSGELVIVALTWSSVEEVLKSIPSEYLANKIVIDVSNAIEFGNPLRLAVANTSMGELVQQWLPKSSVVKTLNMVDSSRFVHPEFEEGTPTMFVAGNEQRAKDQVRRLLEELGWKDIIDLGDIGQSRLQESLSLVCMTCQMQLQAFGAAFALLRK